jgi:hypothetical protein
LPPPIVSPNEERPAVLSRSIMNEHQSSANDRPMRLGFGQKVDIDAAKFAI